MYLFIFLTGMETLPLSERLASSVPYFLYGSGEGGEAMGIQIRNLFPCVPVIHGKIRNSTYC